MFIKKRAEAKALEAGPSDLTQPGDLDAIPWDLWNEMRERSAVSGVVSCDIDLSDQNAGCPCKVRADSSDGGEKVSI